MGKGGTKQTMKKTLVYSVRAEERRWKGASFDLSWERASRATQIFHCSSHVCKGTPKPPEYRLCCYELILVSRQICKYRIYNKPQLYIVDNESQTRGIRYQSTVSLKTLCLLSALDFLDLNSEFKLRPSIYQTSPLPFTEEEAEAWKKEGTCPGHN